jgi:hypothetical protein
MCKQNARVMRASFLFVFIFHEQDSWERLGRPYFQLFEGTAHSKNY